MNLFENLQLMQENSTYESQVDYEVLKQNDIDFFENGSGIYKVVTPEGDMLDIDIELSNNPIDRPKYFVSLPSEDVKSIDVDLTTAIIDVINKLNSFPVYKGSKKIKTESLTNDKLWYKFNELFEGFIPLKDLTNYFSLDQFGEFVQWARKEADMDYDYYKRYRNWDEVFKDLYDVTGSENTDSISIENIFNFFTTADLEDFWEWIEKEYNLEESSKVGKLSIGNKLQTIFDNFDSNIKLIGFMLQYIDEDTIEKMYNEISEVEEATSGIGAGSYTTKAIDLKPASSISKVKKINEKIIKIWDDNFDSEEIKKKVDDIKEHPEDIEMGQYFVVKYEDKTYYVIGDDYKYVTIDGIDTAVSIASDDEYNIYALYFKYKYIDYSDGDAENGMTAPDIEVESSPYKIEKIDKA